MVSMVAGGVIFVFYDFRIIYYNCRIIIYVTITSC